MRACQIIVLVGSILTSSSQGADWCVGPQGAAANRGTPQSPWDIASALDGRKEVRPGDTIQFLEGTYQRRPKELFDVRLAGSTDRPIVVRPAPGARVRIDGGLAVQSPSAHVWLRDLEIFVSEPVPEKPVSAGSHPQDLNRPQGGLHMHGGQNCKYINLVIHHCNQAISCWMGELDPEIYGCILYGNGWRGVDRGHGHCIYTQNDEGTKTISNCIMTCRYDGSYTMHAYGSERASVNNYLLTENICYRTGPFLVGGGRPSHGIRVHRNFLYGIDMRIGYTTPYNEDCDLRDNLIVDGRLEVVRYRKVVQQGNLVVGKNGPRPAQPKCIVLPNKYDPDRAHIVIYNWAKAEAVEVPAPGFVKDGDAVELLDPEDPFARPVLTATCRNSAIRIPVPHEFAAYLARAVRR
ncbi:MAG: right-handed parallel beta-helix repeat-containing protein [Planctomycetes bacterium]|nr:right-handed parallel beta-helix repeat-containing protein [Planctomycetota bacterium]